MSYGPITYLSIPASTAVPYTSAVKRDKFRILWAHLHYTTDATVGNRRVSIGIFDTAGNAIIDLHSDGNQSANNTYMYEFMPGVPNDTTVQLDKIQVGIPPDMIILPNYVIEVFDAAAVGGADTFEGTFCLEEIE